MIVRLRELLGVDETRRYVDMAARIRLWKRDKDGKPVPGELRSTVYGCRWDTLLNLPCEEPPEHIEEISVHPGQLEMVEYERDDVARVLCIGAPGSGKTDAIVRKGLLLALTHPNGAGGVIAPTHPRLKILWRKFCDLLDPPGWIAKTRIQEYEIVLTNGHVLHFVTAKKYSEAVGSAIAGHTWDWAIEDEQQHIEDDSLNEVDARGRVAGEKYTVYSTATNEGAMTFQQRLLEYRRHPLKRVITMGSGEINVFTPISHWEKLQSLWSEDEYRRRVLCEDVAVTNAVYPQFRVSENVRQLPTNAVDVTRLLTQDRFGVAAEYVIGLDPGIAVTASIVMKCFRNKQGEKVWWVIAEHTSKGVTSDYHAELIGRRFEPSDCLVVSDPAVDKCNTADRSDMVLFRVKGFNIVKAATKLIRRKHRYQMVNTMLCDASGNRRLFIDCDRRGRTKAPTLVQSLGSLQYRSDGVPESHNKHPDKDMTHHSDALGYGLYPWERLRGTSIVPETDSVHMQDSMLQAEMVH